MMNKLICGLIVSIGFVLPINIFADQAYAPVRCSPYLKNYLESIEKVPEAHHLIASIQNEGPIQIVARNTHLSNTFGAYWDPDHREICIAVGPGISAGSIIGSIIFELHNAYVNSKISQLDHLAMRGEISQAKYVEGMEYLEYLNSINASKIAEKGIQMGIFPSDARLHTYRNFKEHFAAQKMSGHSACFEQNYRMLSSQGQG